MESNGKIVSMYRIVCKDPEIKESYVGSTKNLHKRRYNHYNHCIKEDYNDYNKYVYQFIRRNGGFDNWEIIEIEKYEALDNEDKLRRERYWFEYYEATLNKNTPFLSKEERYIRCVNRNKERYNNDPEFRIEKNKRDKERYRIKSGYYEKNQVKVI